MKPFFLTLLGVAGLTAAGQSSPQLSVERTAEQSLRIAWTNTARAFGLEQSSSLAPDAWWESVAIAPAEENGQLSVSINALNQEQFFRLISLGLTTVQDTSPLDGETGVAVTRETIIHFSAPLSVDTVLTSGDFYAGYGGRKLLTRVELSSDRSKATLFYLEPMPGSTRVTVVFDGDDLLDQWGQPLDADGDGLPGGKALITFDTLNVTALVGTAVVGQVVASELMPGSDTGTNAVNRPLEGVTITVDGKEQELRTTTDAQGKFTLSPAPPGRFFVKIDGRTAKGSQWPNGNYYPYVGKAWEAVAGKTNNLAGGTGQIFLPLIRAGTLQTVSMTEGTTISFPSAVIAQNPALSGVSVTVPPNSLFNDNGTRGGRVGIAPVPPDRLPGPLPAGLEPPIVITVQTDGALNFDQPAPVCFPNLVDPTLGRSLPAGSKQSLISFNHKKGVWEAVGTMTVSADAKLICTDPGSGILQPGWHLVGPPPDDPPPPPCPDAPAPPPPPNPSSVLTRGRIVALQTEAECVAAAEKTRTDTIARIKKDMLERLGKCTLNAFLGYYGTNMGLCPLNAVQGAMLSADLDEKEADRKYEEDVKKCKDQPPPKPPKKPKVCRKPASGPKPKSTSTVMPLRAMAQQTSTQVVQQIYAIIDQAALTAAPYLQAPEPWPSIIAQQLLDLFASADALAGGDAAAYLNSYFLEAEIRSAEDGTLDEPAGNAPDYPVLYVAEILRPSGSFFIRGQTEPFGQYHLFTPRDGKILSVRFYDPQTKSYAIVYPRLRPNPPWRLPSFELLPVDDTVEDSDHDGMPDVVELVYGTDPHNPDSDGDGIPDGVELADGSDPLNGFLAQTGIVATVKTPGAAVDVTVGNGLVITAEETAGISIFNAYAGENPVILAHVGTPGDAQRVALGGNFLAVAQPDFGLSIIDVSVPSAAAIVQQFPFYGAQAVAIGGDTAYLGVGAAIIAVNLSTGVLRPVYLTNNVRDLALEGAYLYAITDDQFTVFSATNGTLSALGSAPSPFYLKPNQRLFVGGGVGYAIHAGDYNTFDLSVPAEPALLQEGSTPISGWKHLVSNGAGLGLAAVGTSLSFDSEQDVSLYDLSNPRNVNVFLTRFRTPGHAQSVAIYNGLCYVADLEAGLQVINYLAYDNKGVAPKMKLQPGFDTNGVAAGTQVFVQANATDDVQVRNVEFYLDGAKVFTDGSFPFEFRFIVPALTATKTSFSLQARVFDTGGNSTWSETISAKLLQDPAVAGPPLVTFTTPIARGGHTITNVAAYFSKGVDPATLNSASFRVFTAGADGMFGSADDVLVPGTVSYESSSHRALLTFAAPLGIGHYRATIGTDVADPSGHHLAASYSWEFDVSDAAFWVNLAGGPWDAPSNWDTGRVPTASENVVINFPVTVTLRNKITIGRAATGVAGSKLYVPYSTVATLDGLTLNMDLLLDPGIAVRVTNGLTANATVTLPGSPSYTQLIFDGTQLLNGTGQILLNDINYQSTRLEPLSGTLTIGPKLTIRGSGVIGDRDVPVPLVNLGAILANNPAAGASLIVNGSTVENRGLIGALGGAILEVRNLRNFGSLNVSNALVNLTGQMIASELGTVTGQGGLVKILGNIENRNHSLVLDTTAVSWQLAGGTVLGGSIKTTGAALSVAGPGGALDGVVLDSDVNVVPGATIVVTNGLSVNAVVTVRGSPDPTHLRFNGAQTLNGKGQIVLQDVTYRTTGLEPFSGALTLGPELTVRGSGFVGDSTVPLVILGTVTADMSAPGASLTVAGAPVENRGILGAKDGATLIVENLENRNVLNAAGALINLTGRIKSSDLGTVTGSAGTVSVQAIIDNQNSTLGFDTSGVAWQLSGARILGGTIKTSAGQFAITGPKSTFDNLTINADFYLTAGATLVLTNGVSLNAVATLGGSPDYTRLLFDGTQTFSGTGEVLLQDVGYKTTQIVPISGALTLAPTLTIRGVGVVGSPDLPLVNLGKISNDTAAHGTSLTLTGSPLENRGAIDAQQNCVLTVENLENHGAIVLTSATLNLAETVKGSGIGNLSAAGSVVNVVGTLDNRNNNLALDPAKGAWHLAGTILGGVIDAPAGTALTVSAGSATLDGVTLNVDLTIDFAFNLRVTNGLTLNKTAALAGGFNFTQTLNFEGTQTLDGNGSVIFAGEYRSAIEPVNGALLIGKDLTIRGGSGSIGNSTNPLTIQGTVIADGASAVIHLLGDPLRTLGVNTELDGGKIIIGP